MKIEIPIDRDDMDQGFYGVLLAGSWTAEIDLFTLGDDSWENWFSSINSRTMRTRLGRRRSMLGFRIVRKL